MGMEQLGLLLSYYYLTDAKYADKFQMERTKYLGKWKVKDRLPGNDASIDGSWSLWWCHWWQQAQEQVGDAPGAFRLKKENAIAEVGEQSAVSGQVDHYVASTYHDNN